jgi:hypothetical protein
MKQIRAVLVALSVLAVWPALGEDSPTASQLPSARALEKVDGRGALALANAWGKSVVSTLTTSGVSFTFPDGFRRLVALPTNQVVIAVAPYRTRTHPCETHTMSSCQAELVGVPVQVLARSLDGKILIDQTITTLRNGFVELWLPRGIDVRVSLKAAGLAAEAVLHTQNGSPTCITTMQLR